MPREMEHAPYLQSDVPDNIHIETVQKFRLSHCLCPWNGDEKVTVCTRVGTMSSQYDCINFSVIRCAVSIIYAHNVCTVTLYNCIYYVYVHICTGHQRYVSCYSVSPPVHSKRGCAGKKQWLVFIIQFITTLTIIFKCICKLCSLLFCQFKQIKIIFTQIVTNIICQRTDHCRCIHLPPSFQLYRIT